MSAYKQIKDLAIGESATQIFLVASVEGRTTKAGKPYARVLLKDKSGQITANLWDFDTNDYKGFVSGAYARMTIEIEDYQGSRQAKSRAMPMVLAPPDDLNDYESDLKLSKEQPVDSVQRRERLNCPCFAARLAWGPPSGPLPLASSTTIRCRSTGSRGSLRHWSQRIAWRAHRFRLFVTG